MAKSAVVSIIISKQTNVYDGDHGKLRCGNGQGYHQLLGAVTVHGHTLAFDPTAIAANCSFF